MSIRESNSILPEARRTVDIVRSDIEPILAKIDRIIYFSVVQISRPAFSTNKDMSFVKRRKVLRRIRRL